MPSIENFSLKKKKSIFKFIIIDRKRKPITDPNLNTCQIMNGDQIVRKKEKQDVQPQAFYLKYYDNPEFYLKNENITKLCSQKEILQLIAQFLDESGLQ